MKRALFILLSALLLCLLAVSAPAENSNFVSSGGWFAYKDGYMYFFCETTGDGFKIGDLGSTTKEAVEDILFLN